MFSARGRICTLLAVGALGGALASTAAQAATLSPSPGTIAPTTATTSTARGGNVTWVNPSKVGAAVKGVTNQDCENLANAVNSLNSVGLAGAAAQTQDTLNNLCFVID